MLIETVLNYRIKKTNLKYPMQNQMTEVNCKAVKESDETIEKDARRNKGCQVKNMKKYILSDICLKMHDKSIPSIKECHHANKERR